MISSVQTRLSMQGRRSSVGSRGDREGLMRAYDEEAAGFGLTDLTEDSDEDGARRNGNGNGANGHATKAYDTSIEMQPRRSAER